MPRHTDLPAELLRLAHSQNQILRGDQLAQILTRTGLRHALERKTLIKLWKNHYTLPGVELGPDVLLAAADISLGFKAIACLHTAASLYGFDTSRDSRAHIYAPGWHHGSSPLLQIHRHRLLSPVTEIGGRPTVDPAETAVTVAARMPGELTSIAVLDAALQSRHVTVDDLKSYSAQSHINNVRRVRNLIELASPLAESPRESWLRLICIREDLPPVTPQFRVRTRNGSEYRLDLAWPEFKVAVEYDGEEFHTGAALTKDRQRLNALRDAGWTIISVTSRSMYDGREEWLGMVRRAISRAQTASRGGQMSA